MEKIKRITSTILFIPLLISAQETENLDLITDRPDATESPNTVPQNHIQIETGLYYEAFTENDIQQETQGYNTTLLRFGVLKNLEVRLGWDFEETQYSVNNEDLENVLSGFSPLLVGAKVAIAQENKLLPNIGLLIHAHLPFFASKDYRPETTGLEAMFSFSHTLSEKSNLGYNLGASWQNDANGIEYIYTLAYGYSLTDRLGIYGEVYGNLPENNRAQHFADAGITYLVKDNLQLDATVGTGITKGQDILLGAGISYRIPK
ncbi:MAG TPA: transporter [Aequorivita sp.]|nr:transporter [Aequorivita sp.]